jgi:hypothetical protein
MCHTFQWRRDAPLYSYLEGGGKAEGGHGCVHCKEPWGMGLTWVWHASCRCGVKGPLPKHKLIALIPGKVARATCECGWTGIGKFEPRKGEDHGDDDFQKDVAAAAARNAHFEHRDRRTCHCECHLKATCLAIHADRRDQMLLRRFTFVCEHSA